MGFFKRVLGGDKEPERTPPPEQAVIVSLLLSNAAFGQAEERDAIHALTDRLDAAIREAGAGEFDGDEFGDGTCTLYMYGPDADSLFAAVEPLLRGSTLAKGGHAIKRYGPASDRQSREVRVEFDA
jgi:hypothetical protein